MEISFPPSAPYVAKKVLHAWPQKAHETQNTDIDAAIHAPENMRCAGVTTINKHFRLRHSCALVRCSRFSVPGSGAHLPIRASIAC